MSEGKINYLRWIRLGQCKRCTLHQNRLNIVFGDGSLQPSMMFIGEAPGHDENIQGQPFVGPSGERLNLWLEKAGIDRSSIYITNIVKCKPPFNRDPFKEEVAACTPFLHAQIWTLAPRHIIALGRVAGNFLAGTEDVPLYALQGKVLEYKHTRGTIPLSVVPHPAYALRRQDPKVDVAVIKTLRTIARSLSPSTDEDPPKGEETARATSSPEE